jgi:hypothetical protein
MKNVGGAADGVKALVVADNVAAGCDCSKR